MFFLSDLALGLPIRRVRPAEKSESEKKSRLGKKSCAATFVVVVDELAVNERRAARTFELFADLCGAPAAGRRTAERQRIVQQVVLFLKPPAAHCDVMSFAFVLFQLSSAPKHNGTTQGTNH